MRTFSILAFIAALSSLGGCAQVEEPTIALVADYDDESPMYHRKLRASPCHGKCLGPYRKCNKKCGRILSFKKKNACKTKCSLAKFTCTDKCDAGTTCRDNCLELKAPCLKGCGRKAGCKLKCHVSNSKKINNCLNGCIYRCSTSSSKPLPSGTRIALDKAASGTVCILSRASDDVAFGRSYEAGDWEEPARSTRTINTLAFDHCYLKGYCEVQIPADGEQYRLVAFQHSLTEREKASRFLAQATFGPTLGEINSFSGSYKGWVVGQMAKTPTLHRQHQASHPANDAKSTWLMIALSAGDQLRQRVAFALSGIISVGRVGGEDDYSRAAFYDIFVSNAFGNYRDVLQEITFNPMMGDWLTYTGSKSFGYSKGEFPDENYARELMQLFTIGLSKLKQDGTFVVDVSTGEPVPTYEIDDISEYFLLHQPVCLRSGTYNSQNLHFNRFLEPFQCRLQEL